METSGHSTSLIAPPVEGVAGGGTSYGWTDGDMLDSKILKGSIDPTKISTANMLHVWCMPNTVNISQQEMPRPLNPVSLLAARNERESVQIALRPKLSWSTSGIAGAVQIHCTDLCSSSGDKLLGQSVTLRRVVPVLGVPDALVPLDATTTQVNLQAGETTVVWVSIDVSGGQPPGLYEGQIVFTALKIDPQSLVHCLTKDDNFQVYSELKNFFNIIEPLKGNSSEEMIGTVKSATPSLKKLLQLPSFRQYYGKNATTNEMEEDDLTDTSIILKFSVTVWDFTLPLTPSLPAVFGISETVIEDRFGLEHGTDGWYEALDRHFKWILQYRISPFFCRWGDSMRILAYTCPWPADHPRSDEYYSDPRLAAYAVPFAPILSYNEASKESFRKEVEILKLKAHWRKAYIYLWDEPVNLEQYELIRSMSSDIRRYAPDARILTTYHSGPKELGLNTYEGFLKVPTVLRPHTQIYCTSEWVLGTQEHVVKDITAEIQPENGEEWWTYVCMGPTDPQPNWHLGMHGTQHRAVMWRVWKEGGTGFLYWGANCYEKAKIASAEVVFRRGLPPGDGVLFYPGEVFSSSHEPVASVRLERILSGMQDMEYLNLYTSRFGKEEALALIAKTGLYQGPDRYTLDHTPIDIVRAEIYRTCSS